MIKELKLNLGCGNNYLDGYVNVDAYTEHKVDQQYNIIQLPYEDKTVDEIRAFHVIEHFHYQDGQRALKEWCRVLKPGGRLHIETPDFLESCKEFVGRNEAGRVNLYGHFFSTPWVPGQSHYFLFTESQLRSQLSWAGFVKIKRLPASSKYLDHYPMHLFLNLEAYKSL